MYAKVSTTTLLKFPYTLTDLYEENPSTQFPSEDVDVLYARTEDSVRNKAVLIDVKVDSIPTYDTLNQSIDLNSPVLINGNWVQSWSVRNATAQEIEDRKKAIQNSIVDATQLRLDTFAQTRNYNGILSASTYATSNVARFQAEGEYCVNQRDATWAKLYQILAEVQAGTRPMPTGYADIEAELPVLVWP